MMSISVIWCGSLQNDWMFWKQNITEHNTPM
jgi:hypothetical protein